MKHLPNLLTLGNLFCGCIAIVFILNSQPFQASINGIDFYYVTGTEEVLWGVAFIGIAAVCDILDGFTARILNIHSHIGLDLDSLADVVSFGVAPSMILFKMLWASWMREEGALDVSMLAMAPAFLIACFAALRLAKFNVTVPEDKGSFTGMPTPAIGLVIASFPLINYYNSFHLGEYFQNKWFLYSIIVVFCWLMVSQIHFFKFMHAKCRETNMWRQFTLLGATIAAIPFLKAAAFLFGFLLYILLSFTYKQPKTVQ